MHSSKLNAGLD